MKKEDLKKIIKEEINLVLQEQVGSAQIKEVMEIIKILGVSPYFSELLKDYQDQFPGLSALYDVSREFHTSQYYYRAAPALKIEPDSDDFSDNMNTFLLKLEKSIKSGSLKNVLSTNLNFLPKTAIFINNSLADFIKKNKNKTNIDRPSSNKKTQEVDPLASGETKFNNE